MNGVIYARYSCENQREESIEGQLRECTAFAERSGITVIGTYIDRAFSAKTDRRPEFQKMIKDSAKKSFEAIIVWKLDRFARNRYDSATYKARLRKNGVRVISATETISQGSEGILLESVLEGMAEYYSVDLSEKVLRGHMENAYKCVYNGGNLTLGYVIDSDKHYQLDPIVAPIVKQAFIDYSQGKMMHEIADDFARKGILSKRGKKASINTVTRILQNRRYLGEYRYRDCTIPDGIPRLIDDDLFHRVQEQLSKNKKAPARHKAEDDYILTTKLFCGHCSTMMFGESGTSKQGLTYRYYKCASSKKKTGCNKKAVKKLWIEDLVIDAVHDFLLDHEMIDRVIDAILDMLARENTVVPMLKKELAETQKGISNLVAAVEHGIYSESTQKRLLELEARSKELQKQIDVESFKQPTVTREQLKFWFGRMAKTDVTKKEQRERLVNTFVNSVFLFDDRIVITFNYKNGTKTISLDDVKNSDILGVSPP